MLNKKELVLIAVAFVAGAMFSETFNSRDTFAQNTTTNYVIDIVNQKIAVVAADVAAVGKRVSTLEQTTSQNNTKITTLAETIKQLVSLQKSNDVTKLKSDVETLKAAVKVLKDK